MKKRRYTTIVMLLIGSLLISFACLILGCTQSPLFFIGGCWFCINLAFWLFQVAVTLFVDTSKPRTVPHPFYYALIQTSYRWLLWLGWVQVRSAGFEQIPADSSCLIVANHGSYFDNFMISLAMSAARKTVFISKPENFKIFVCGGLMAKCAYIPIIRGNPRLALESILKAIQVIKNNTAHVGVFPEGTRSKDGTIAPFKPGAFKISTKTGCPIVIIGIRNNHAIRRRAPWLPTTVECRVLEVISPENRSTIELAEYCQARIAQYLTA